MDEKGVNQKDSNLIRRYLIWCYKTTKEDLDKIDRYFTQKIVDDFISEDLKKLDEMNQPDFANLVNEFQSYKEVKIQKANKTKFEDGDTKQCRGEYLYLQKRFEAIEKAIEKFLGLEDLKEIESLYEQEMTQRILTAREHT